MGGDGQRPPDAFGAGARPGEVALITTEDVAVQFGDVRNAGVAADEVAEQPRVASVPVEAWRSSSTQARYTSMAWDSGRPGMPRRANFSEIII